MNVKKCIIYFFIVFCTFFISVFILTNTDKSEIDLLREKVEINNINIEAHQEGYYLSEQTIKNQNIYLIEYFVSNDESLLTHFNEKTISDIKYFKYIMEVNKENNITIEEVLRSKMFRNYQFYNKENNSFIDYYYYKGINLIPATLEIVYRNGEVIESKIY